MKGKKKEILEKKRNLSGSKGPEAIRSPLRSEQQNNFPRVAELGKAEAFLGRQRNLKPVPY